MKKNILLIPVLAVIVGAIWYIEATKVHPGETGNAAPQAIGITASPAPLPPTAFSTGTSSQTAGDAAAIKALAAADQKAGYQPAIEIAGPTGFVNASSGFTLGSLIGKKIILLDFWTYSCINCIRTLPYLTAWYGRYASQGLEIVGIHTPEFDFEKDINNVRAATVKYGIKYPVVLDSNYGTWTAYGNLYWPHEYLIDLAGYIVHDQVGEGNYSETEAEIQKLLAQRDQILGLQPGAMPTSTVAVSQSGIAGGALSPETYFGSARNEYLANGTPGAAGEQDLAQPQTVNVNQLNLVGDWNFQGEYATNLAAGAKIIYKYQAAKMYLVASAPKPVTVEVLLDGQPIDNSKAGSDVRGGKMTIQASRLYNIVNDSAGSGEHVLELTIDSPGLQAYTFTFGLVDPPKVACLQGGASCGS